MATGRQDVANRAQGVNKTTLPLVTSVFAGAPETRRLAGPVVPRSAYVVLDLSVPVILLLQTPTVSLAMVAMMIGYLSVWIWCGLYRVSFTASVLDDFPAILLGLAAGAGVAAVSDLILSRGGLPDMSRTLVLIAVVSILGRAVLYTVERRARATGHRCIARAVVIGEGPTSRELIDAMSGHTTLGVVPVGRVSVPGSGEGASPIDAPPLGQIHNLARIVELHGVSHIFIADGMDEDQVTEALQVAGEYRVRVYQTDRFRLAKWNRAADSDQLWGIPVRDITPGRTDGVAYGLKRLFDLVVALSALMILLPVMVAVACAVWLESRSVIYRQVRIGQFDREFTLYKFTSMLPAPGEGSHSAWSIAGDRRVGPVGRFIRRTSLDELPQLINVVRGDMSIVGPRPERPEFVGHFTKTVPGYRYRLRVPVGLTGYAAVNGLRGDTSIHDRAVFDNIYIANWSLWLDVKIILQTVTSVFGGRGA